MLLKRVLFFPFKHNIAKHAQMKSESTWRFVARPLTFVELTNFRFVGYCAPLPRRLPPFRNLIIIHCLKQKKSLTHKNFMFSNNSRYHISSNDQIHNILLLYKQYRFVKKTIFSNMILWKYQKKWVASSIANAGCASAKTRNQTRFM